MFHFWVTEDGLGTIVIPKEYGFDIASGLGLQTIFADITYNEVMTQVIVPPGHGELIEPLNRPNIYIDWHSQDDALFSVEREGGDLPGFYIFDVNNKMLKDYCQVNLNYGWLTELEAGAFLAWSSELPDDDVPKEILILNISSGHVACIKNAGLLDWGKMP
jgi:hypothetical protein